MIPIRISSPIFVRGKMNITTQKIVSIPITISAFIQYQLCGCLFFHYTTDWLQDAVTVSLQHKNIHVQQSTWVQRVHRLSSHTIYLQESPVLYKNIFFAIWGHFPTGYKHTHLCQIPLPQNTVRRGRPQCICVKIITGAPQKRHEPPNLMMWNLWGCLWWHSCVYL